MIKPTSYNRGRGIRIFNDIKTLISYIREYRKGVKESAIFRKNPCIKPQTIEMIPKLINQLKDI